MELKETWLTDGLIDFEFKKYILLAYLKDVTGLFDNKELFPSLSDLIFHYRNLKKVKENKELITNDFPKEITAADLKKLEIIYRKLVKEDEFMEEIEQIVEFAIPRFKGTLEKGKEVYEYLESNIEINSIGLSPLYQDEGYVFIKANPIRKSYKIYRYVLRVFENAREKFRGLSTEYLETARVSIAHSFESKKMELTKRFKELPNPATYLIESSILLPYKETMMPISKRLLVRYISSSDDKVV